MSPGNWHKFIKEAKRSTNKEDKITEAELSEIQPMEKNYLEYYQALTKSVRKKSIDIQIKAIKGS